MIDKEEFERNFVAHNKQVLNGYNIDVVRLRARADASKYRAVEFLTKPLDEERAPLGYLRSQKVAKNNQVSISVENFGRGEGETMLKRSFSIKITEYGRGHDKDLLDALERLKSAENEFYNP